MLGGGFGHDLDHLLGHLGQFCRRLERLGRFKRRLFLDDGNQVVGAGLSRPGPGPERPIVGRFGGNVEVAGWLRVRLIMGAVALVVGKLAVADFTSLGHGAASWRMRNASPFSRTRSDPTILFRYFL